MKRKHSIIITILALAIAATIISQSFILPQTCKPAGMNGVLFECYVSYSGYLFLLGIVLLSIIAYMLIKFHYGRPAKT